MTLEEFRELALELTGNQQGTNPDFRVGKKVFASLRRQCGMVKVDAATQQDLLQQYPETVQAKSYGGTWVNLGQADREFVAQALQSAWRRARG